MKKRKKPNIPLMCSMHADIMDAMIEIALRHRAQTSQERSVAWAEAVAMAVHHMMGPATGGFVIILTELQKFQALKDAMETRQ